MNQQGFDYYSLRKEAQVRWLKPPEILYILQNHERYPISPAALQKPPSGSLFLFNRRVLRYFRKDGHNWRKKKDGKNVGEAHERLKVGNVDALNCYYAHGEQNPHFQRRSYWMLDPAYEHIVLVHYREVSEGRYLGSISTISTDSCSTINQSISASTVQHQGFTYGNNEQYDQNGCSCSLATAEEVSSKPTMGKVDDNDLQTTDGVKNSDFSPQPEVSLALRKLKMQLSLEDDFGEKFPVFSNEYEKSQDFGLLDHQTREPLQETHINQFHAKCWERNQIENQKQDGSSNIQSLKVSGDNGKQGSQSAFNTKMAQTSWNDTLGLSSGSTEINLHGRTTNLLAPAGILESSLYARGSTSSLLPPEAILETSSGANLHNPVGKQEQFAWAQHDHEGYITENGSNRQCISKSNLSLQLASTKEFLLGPDNHIESPTAVSDISKVQMQNNCWTSMSGTSNDVAKFGKQNSTDWMATVELDIPNSAYSSDFSSMWFDQDQFDTSLGDDSSLTVAEKQWFSICEISPEWAFSSESTKVIITGNFLCGPSECSWAIMFGDIQVPAEIVQEGVLRCMTPQHGDGKVSLCVTSANRESCSEVREFEFRPKPATSNSTVREPRADPASNSEELLLLVRLIHMLLSNPGGSSLLNTSTEAEGSSQTEARWSEITEALLAGSEVPSDVLFCIVQELLKDKLHHWLSSKRVKDGLLSKPEQGVIHIISGLGYRWALNPVLEAGVGVNFRDANGWTALHWAARFGREEMVGALLAAGASAGAVTDPTPQDPIGKTAGAIAAASGHSGLAGYLSEADLTSHLSSLTMEESEILKGSAEVEAERAVESISERSVQMHVGGTEEELSLKDSLAAVRNATQAAARIQAAFRAHSFRKKQQRGAASEDEYGMTPEDLWGISSSSKFPKAVHGSRGQKIDRAALSIQKKYRGWKGRRDFLILRQNVVKIQAHFRGYQERKKYRLVQTVSVLEKAVLRWRRKGAGLRGYRAEPELIDEEDEEVEDILKVFRKQKVDAAVEQAVSRVLSMVESPMARRQYRRMLEKYRQAKAESVTAEEATSRLTEGIELIGNSEMMYY